MPDCIQTRVEGVQGQQTLGNDIEGTLLAGWLLKSPQLWVQVPELNIFSLWLLRAPGPSAREPIPCSAPHSSTVFPECFHCPDESDCLELGLQ